MHATALKSLTTPGMAYQGLLYEVIADIRALDCRGELPDAAFRSGVRQAIAERIPPGPVSLDWPAARLPPGSTPADAARYITSHLEWNRGPATLLLGELIRDEVMFRAQPFTRLRLAKGEAEEFDAAPKTEVWEREGVMLVPGRLTVAHTMLRLLPSRIPPEALEDIEAGMPVGEVMEPFGWHRDPRKVFVSPASRTVEASAGMWFGKRKIGDVREHITAETCEHVAALAG